MSRSKLFYWIIACAFSVASCDNSVPDTVAQMHDSRTTLTAGVVEAGDRAGLPVPEPAPAAHATAAPVPATFAATREGYRQRVQSDLNGLEQKLNELDAKTRAATGAAKTDLDAKLPAIRRQRDAFLNDFHTIDRETVDTWETARVRLDRELAELKAAIERIT
jgi:hypothetical protein